MKFYINRECVDTKLRGDAVCCSVLILYESRVCTHKVYKGTSLLGGNDWQGALWHCNTLQHTATLWGGNDLQAAPSDTARTRSPAAWRQISFVGAVVLQCVAVYSSGSWALYRSPEVVSFVHQTPISIGFSYCNKLDTLRHAATHCDTLQHTATHCSRRLCVTDSDLYRLVVHKTTLQHTTEMRYLLVHKAITSSACARQDITYLQCVAVPSCAQVCSSVILCIAVSFCAPQHKMTLHHTCSQDFTATRCRCVVSCRAQEALVMSLLAHSVVLCTSVLQCRLMLQCTQWHYNTLVHKKRHYILHKNLTSRHANNNTLLLTSSSHTTIPNSWLLGSLTTIPIQQRARGLFLVVSQRRSQISCSKEQEDFVLLQRVAVCCSVLLQCVAVCCRVLQQRTRGCFFLTSSQKSD